MIASDGVFERFLWLARSGGSETLVSMWEIQREEREELLDAPLSASDASEEEVLWEQDWHSDACSDGVCRPPGSVQRDRPVCLGEDLFAV